RSEGGTPDTSKTAHRSGADLPTNSLSSAPQRPPSVEDGNSPQGRDPLVANCPQYTTAYISTLADCFGHSQSVAMRFGFMHSEYSRAFFTTKAGECYARPESFRSRRSIGEPSQEGLPGDAQQDGPAQLGEAVERSKKGEVMLGVLPKTNSRINYNSFHGHAVAYRGPNALSKEFGYLGDHVVIAGILL